MAGVRYGLLGRLEVLGPDGEVPVGSIAQRLLLTMLLVEAGSCVAADRLCEELWGDALPEDPAGALRTQVSRLRRRLGPASADLRTHAGGYGIVVADGALDAARFEALLRDADDADDALEAVARYDDALALWRGRAIEEFADRAFAMPVAARLEELRLAALERRAARLGGAGRHDDAAAALEALLAEHPERERARAALMEALYRAGRHTRALQVFRAWRDDLAERGLEPSPALVELEGLVLGHRLPPAPLSRLPVPVSSFVGRAAEAGELGRLLLGSRLVTLVGPGGVGKTRLGIEVAAAAAGAYPQGVVFCDLAALRRGSEVVRAVASAVGVSERTAVPLREQLTEHLAGARVLVVLDNCEHVADGASSLAEWLVQHTGGVDVLATSRVRLAADGEQVFPVRPLDAAAAAALFTERARAVDSRFEGDADTLRTICERLDGLPLAIELAAARCGAVPPAQLLDLLRADLTVLEGGARTTARHRSLVALVDWSYDHLDAGERATFEALSTFAGSFDLDAAASVAAHATDLRLRPGELAAAVLRLVERSLVGVERERDATRYRLLETLRAYGLARLEESGSLRRARDAHARWALALAESAGARIGGAREAEAAAAIEASFDELRAAHAWLVGVDVDAALRLSDALHPWAFWRSASEVFRWAETATAAAGGASSPLAASVAASAAAGAWQRGDLAAAEATARTAGASRRATSLLAEVAFLRGDLAGAREGYRAAARASEEAGDLLQAVWEEGSALLSAVYDGVDVDVDADGSELVALAGRCGSPTAHAFVHYVRAEAVARRAPDVAERELRAALARAAESGSTLVAGFAHVSLATLHARTRDPLEALGHFEHVIGHWSRTGAWTPQLVTLRSLVGVLERLGLRERAATLYGAVRRPRTGAPAFGADAALLDEVASRLDGALGAEAVATLAAAGEAMGGDAVIQLALDAIEEASGRLRPSP